MPSGRIGIVDIDALKSFDPDTEAELVQAYIESAGYLATKAFLPGTELALTKEFIRRKEAELTNPIQYFDSHIGPANAVFRLIITHPDMDHMTGIADLYHGKTLLNLWHIGPHDYNLGETTDQEWAKSPYAKDDWETYKALRYSSNSPKSLVMRQGHTGDYWTEDGIELWAPTAELVDLSVERNQANIASMLLKVSYKGRVVVLGGDATADETWAKVYPHIDMKGVDVLKASHHGRKTGYYWPAVKEMQPWLTITSVGEKAYDATENYRRYSAYTVSLRDSGNIRITIDDDGTLFYPSEIEEHWKPKKD